MKMCNSCNTIKHAGEFHVRNASKDGLAAKCKSCQSEYDKLRANNPDRVEARNKYLKTERGKEAAKKARKKWLERNVIKRAVHIITGNAIRNGILVKENCENCSKEKINAHHDDYAIPLKVRWLCSKCHILWHKENGEGKNAT